MKKIIDNKVYCTDTATKIGCNYYSHPGDFDYWCEELYRKRTGEYFLFGEGGPNTRYSVSCGQNSWSGGFRIIPMSYDSAREWAEANLSADEFEAEFGAVTEDDTATTISISLPASVAERIRSDARKQGVSVSALIASLFN